ATRGRRSFGHPSRECDKPGTLDHHPSRRWLCAAPLCPLPLCSPAGARGMGGGIRAPFAIFGLIPPCMSWYDIVHPTPTPVDAGAVWDVQTRLFLEGAYAQEGLDRTPSGPTAGANGRERRAVGDVECRMIERRPFVAHTLISECQHESHEGVFLGF